MHENVHNTYTKGPLFCVMLADGKTTFKYPWMHIFRVEEHTSVEQKN